MNKSISVILGIFIFAAALSAAGYFIFKDKGEKGAEQMNFTGKPTVVAYGDSLVYGLGATKGNDFVSILSEKVKDKINGQIINLGISGDTTSDGLARLDYVFREDPDIVILLLGGNDFLRQTSPEIVFKNLEEIIDRLQAEGIQMILLGIRGGYFGDGYKGRFEDLAEKKDVAYVPNVLDGIIGNREYMSDQIHPNDKGYLKIADKVYPVLLRMLP